MLNQLLLGTIFSKNNHASHIFLYYFSEMTLFRKFPDFRNSGVKNSHNVIYIYFQPTFVLLPNCASFFQEILSSFKIVVLSVNIVKEFKLTAHSASLVALIYLLLFFLFFFSGWCESACNRTMAQYQCQLPVFI